MRYLDDFFKLKCAPDVMGAICPITAGAKEITESMGIISALRSIMITERPNVTDMCAGNAITSIILAHMFNVECTAIDKYPRLRPGMKNVKRFKYLTYDIYDKFPCTDDKKIVIISSHPCKGLAERIVEIYNEAENAIALVLLPCCKGQISSQYGLINDKMSKYERWGMHLANKCVGKVNLYRDNSILSPCNLVVMAEK